MGCKNKRFMYMLERMPLKVRNLQRAGIKLQETAAARSGDYVAGVLADTSWVTNTAAATQNYNAGVQLAVTKNLFSKGVTKAGQSGYQEGVARVGQSRYAQGVADSGETWAAAFAPYAAAIGAQNLPARGTKGSEANYSRMLANAKLIRTVKERLQS